MHISSMFLAAVAATTVTAGYQVDPNMEDGVYIVPRMANWGLFHRSEEVYGQPIRVGDANTTLLPKNDSDTSIMGTVPVPIDLIQCIESTEWPPAHDGAKAMLAKWCDEGKKVHGMIGLGAIPGTLIARYGSSIAYVCNLGHRQGCASNEIEDAWLHISDKCGGHYKGGDACAMKKWRKCYGHSTVIALICEERPPGIASFIEMAYPTQR